MENEDKLPPDWCVSTTEGTAMRFRIIGLALLEVVIVSTAPVVQAETLEELKEAVRQTDITFDRAVAERDLELFKSLVAPDAVFLGGAKSEGREAIVEAWSGFFAPDRTATLTWKPHTVEIANSGDLAYTLGDYESHSVQDGDMVTTSVGTYLTVWRRQADGSWQAVADGGTPPQPVGDSD
jgi:uncharacterized protein (TIGR02246 family)